MIFEAMTATYEQRSLVWVAFASADELHPENYCEIYIVIYIVWIKIKMKKQKY
jgi:hypothetical protein